jgi:polyhydroxyalkanoate synthesis regulator phasin
MMSMQREGEKGIKQLTKLGGLGDMKRDQEPAAQGASSELKAELDSLKEKLKDLEEKLEGKP